MNTPNLLADEVKAALRTTADSVHVVSLRNDSGKFYAMTATAVTVVSLDPASLLVCVNESSAFYEQIIDNRYFAINTLTTDQQALSNACAGGVSNEEREAMAQWTQDRAPMLINSQASYLCESVSVLQHGTHAIVVGKVVKVISPTPSLPLVYFDGQYTSPRIHNT